jgi:hypothetical protein
MFDDKPDTVEHLEHVWNERGIKTEYFDNRIDLEALIERLFDTVKRDEVVVPALDVKFPHSFDVLARDLIHRIINPQVAGVEIIEFLTRQVGLVDVPYILMSSAEAEQDVLERVARLSREGINVRFVSKHDTEEKVVEKTNELLRNRYYGGGKAKLLIDDEMIDMLLAGQNAYKAAARGRGHMQHEYGELTRGQLRELIRSRVFEAISSRAEEMRLGAAEYVALFDGIKLDHMFVIELFQNLPIRLDEIGRFLLLLRRSLIEFLENGGSIEYRWGRLLLQDDRLIFDLAAAQPEGIIEWKKPDGFEFI